MEFAFPSLATRFHLHLMQTLPRLLRLQLSPGSPGAGCDCIQLRGCGLAGAVSGCARKRVARHRQAMRAPCLRQPCRDAACILPFPEGWGEEARASIILMALAAGNGFNRGRQ